jgi:ribonuclease HI
MLFFIKECGVIGVGGIAYDPGGNDIFAYAWGLGKVTNNQVEVHASYMGLKILKNNPPLHVVLIGYLELVIT